MTIRPRITLENNRLKVSINPIILKKGDKLEFEVWSNFTNSEFPVSKDFRLKWEIYFENGSPFRNSDLQEQIRNFDFITESSESIFRFRELNHHAGIMELGKAEKKGEYKYGIKATNADNEDDELDDFDPLIIVL